MIRKLNKFGIYFVTITDLYSGWGNQIYNKNLFLYILASIPNSGSDVDTFEYCQYEMEAFEFHKL